MDIKIHLNLRSFARPSVQPITMAMGIALVLHVLFFISWQAKEKIIVAEIPQWINVTLSSGVEEVTVSKKKSLQKDNYKNKQVKGVRNIKSEQALNKTEDSKKETTFIKANSHAYDIENSKPIYPSAARRRGMQGVVLLSVDINNKGYVDKIKIIKTSGFRALDRSAINSVESWRFIPAKSEDIYVASQLEIPIRFILKN